MNQSTFRALGVALVFTLLSACGFHLRGTIDEVSADKRLLALSAESTNPAFVQTLKRALRDNGIQLSDEAPYALTLLGSRFQRDSVSLDRDARVDEYSLEMSLDFRLQAVGHEKTQEQTLTVERVYTYSAAAAAAKDEQEALLRREMHEALASRVIQAYLSFDPAQ